MKQYQELRFRRNAELAARAAREESAALKRRFAQQRTVTAQRLDENARRARLARATALVAAGEGGGLGQSADSLLDTFRRRELEFASTIERSLAGQAEQLGRELEGVQIRQQSRTSQFLPQPVQRPNYLQAALNIGASAFNAFGEFQQREELRALRQPSVTKLNIGPK